MKNTELLRLFNNSSKKMVNDRCVVGCCDNDKRYPDRMIIHSNVTSGKLVFHKIPVNEERRKAWIHAVSKGREAFNPRKFSRFALTILSMENQPILTQILRCF